MLTNESITFGKYKGKTLGHVLKDRGYCDWLTTQEWFKDSYEYLYNRICEYKPRSYFIGSDKKECDDFLSDYAFFNLKPVKDIELPLTLAEKMCYEYYLKMIHELLDRVYTRLENEEENPFDIKAPTKWLQRFERECGIPRTEFKEFLASYDLINIPYIVKRIKKEGGLEYKGAESFLIAKARSVEQEKWWEHLLNQRYGESLAVQFTYKKCIFDFLNIDTKTIFECKLGLKDFCENQHFKYKLSLEKYRIIYLVAKDCVIDMEQRKIFTTNSGKYEAYLSGVSGFKKPSYLDLLMVTEEFSVVAVNDVPALFGTK
jgi:hypothetical protein